MNKNLIKILALGAIASMALSGCINKNSGKNSDSSQSGSEGQPSSEPGPQAEVVTLDEVFEYDTMERDFVKTGSLVTLEQLCVYARWGHTLIVGVPYVQGGSILSLHGVEVELDKQPDWKGVTKGRYANVNVTGTVANVDGRPVLQGANVQINAEAQYDGEGNRIDNDGAFSAAYWSTGQTIRSNWDDKMGRSMSGVLMEGIFQLATAPQAITSETSTDFKVVFPGENTNGAAADNEYLINVHVPQGLSEDAAAAYNSFFVGKQAGDFVDMMGMSRFDASKKGMGFVLDDFWTKYAANVKDEDKPTILTQWSEIEALYNPKFKQALPSLANADVFSYTLTDAFTGGPADLFSEETLAGLAIDVKKSGAFMVDMNCGSAKAASVFADITGKLEEQGYALDEELSDTTAKDLYYVLKVADKAVAEINVWVAEKNVSLIFCAERATDQDCDSVAAALAVIQSRILAADANYASAIPAIPSEVEAIAGEVVADWKQEEVAEGVLAYSIDIVPTDGAFADDAAWEAFADGVEAFFAAASFVEGFSAPAFIVDGSYNATSKEFVAVYLNTDAEDAYTDIEIVIMYNIGGGIYDCRADSQWTVEMASAYLQLTLPQVFGAGKGAPYQGNIADLYVGGYYDTSLNQVLSYFANYCLPGCAQYLGTDSTTQEDGETKNVMYAWALNSQTEGKYIQLTAFFEGIPGAGASYFDVLIGEYDLA